MKQALITFIRNPELGKGKTRLAKDSSKEYALEIYIKLLEHTRKVCEQTDAERYVFYADCINAEDEWSTDDFQKRLQLDGGLGEKMKDAFSTVFSEGCNKAVIIGSDCPDISSELIENAFSELNSNDFVIGPSNDGGYYLLGMNTLFSPIFENKTWSTETVLEETVKDISDAGFSLKLLKPLTDVDHLEDVPQKWR